MSPQLQSDNLGRRLNIERRQFSYDVHIPERRSGNDRRSGLDRRLMSTGTIIIYANQNYQKNIIEPHQSFWR
jgi:hypothetical protein